jgi:hypothetical protein
LLDDVKEWTALSICRICPPEVEKRSILEHCSLYRLFTLLLGEMLDVASYGAHGAKLRKLCQGSYVSSTQTKQNLPFGCHFFQNRNDNHTS